MTGRRFVLVCANARDRERVRYAVSAGYLELEAYDHVDYVLIRDVDRSVRGLTIAGWGFTEEALTTTRGWVEQAERLLRSRASLAGEYRLADREEVVSQRFGEADRFRPLLDELNRRKRQNEGDTPDGGGA